MSIFIPKKNKKSNKKEIIAHYVGGNPFPTYPPSKDYARSVMLLYKPWVNTFKYPGRDYIKEFYEYIDSPHCSNVSKTPYHQIRMWYINKTNTKSN